MKAKIIQGGIEIGQRDDSPEKARLCEVEFRPVLLYAPRSDVVRDRVDLGVPPAVEGGKGTRVAVFPELATVEGGSGTPILDGVCA